MFIYGGSDAQVEARREHASPRLCPKTLHTVYKVMPLLFSAYSPQGGRGCLMPRPCLESQGCHLFPLYYLLSCSSVESCYSFCRIFFLPSCPLSWLQCLSLRIRDRLFLYVFYYQLLKVSWSVVCAASSLMWLVFAVMHSFHIITSRDSLLVTAPDSWSTVSSSNPSRSGGRMFFSRFNFCADSYSVFVPPPCYRSGT